MRRADVQIALTQNVDCVVELCFYDGETATARLILVDEEGVVFDCIRSNREQPHGTTAGAACWATFEEIAEVVVPRALP